MDKMGIQVISLVNQKEIVELQQLIKNFDKKRMERLFSTLNFPITIVYENYYVDKLFRDTYYTFFSSKHFEISRTCERITLFEGEYSYKNFLDSSMYGELQRAIIGTIVLRPTKINSMGRTLLNPCKMHIGRMYLRTTEFEISLLGKIYKIQAYPFLTQDTETMTCAETSIWTMLEYYGTCYPEYRTVLPNEILDELGNLSSERVLPSHGLDYRQKSSLLKKFGFYPRVYMKKVYTKDFRKLFHYYVESGIPVTLSLEGHSVVCIGHGAETYDISIVSTQQIGKSEYIDSNDFIEKYVIVDDNQIPYSLEKFDEFSVFKREMILFTVPLYKRIFLEGNDASTIIEFILEKIDCLIQNCIKKFKINYDEENNPLVKRLFLTSSRKYKKVRVTNASSEVTQRVYSELPLPKFIWVCEISTLDNYQNKRMFAEIVIDATASRYDHISSTILIRIGNTFAYRLPDEGFDKIKERLNFSIKGFDVEFNMYENNLMEVE